MYSKLYLALLRRRDFKKCFFCCRSTDPNRLRPPSSMRLSPSNLSKKSDSSDLRPTLEWIADGEVESEGFAE